MPYKPGFIGVGGGLPFVDPFLVGTACAAAGEIHTHLSSTVTRLTHTHTSWD